MNNNISKEDLKISRFLSLILRHKPEEINLKLDKHGWLNVKDVIIGMNQKGYKINIINLKRIVKEDDKQRYSFNEDYTKIRANQGHSINIILDDLKETIPPLYLYHGTSYKYKNSIFKDGLLKQKRQYVHLSNDIETAIKVGQRHSKQDKVCLLRINSKKMYEDKHIFYLSKNKVWLIDYVPSKYIEEYSIKKE